MAVPVIISSAAASIFGFIWRKVLFLSVFTLFWQSLLAIGLLVFVSPDFYINLLNKMLAEFGLEPIDCNALPAEVCPLLNIFGIHDLYVRILGCVVSLILINFILASVKVFLKAFAIWLRF